MHVIKAEACVFWESSILLSVRESSILLSIRESSILLPIRESSILLSIMAEGSGSSNFQALNNALALFTNVVQQVAASTTSPQATAQPTGPRIGTPTPSPAAGSMFYNGYSHSVAILMYVAE